MQILRGIKIIEVGQGVSAPFCSMMLADMGADVIKVESPDPGDVSHQWGPPFVGSETAYYLSVNRTKKSIVLDLKSDEGRDILTKLCRSSDVLIENYRPGVMARLGLGYEQLKSVNPGLIYCSISGYGQNGPSKEDHAFDLVIQARSGLMDITGSQEPAKVGIPIVDIGAGMYSAYGIALALIQRQKTGEGNYLDIALLDTAVSWLCFYITGYEQVSKTHRRLGTAHPTIAPYQLFNASDGYVAIAASTNDLWEKTCKALGLDELLQDPRFKDNAARVAHREELVKLIGSRLEHLSKNEVAEELGRAGVPSEPFQSVSDVLSDKQVVFRDMVHRINHPKLGNLLVPGNPIRFGAEVTNYLAPPERGQNTREILSLLGYSESDMQRLKTMKIAF